MTSVSEGMCIPWQSDDWYHPSGTENLLEVKVCTAQEYLMINAICQTPNDSRKQRYVHSVAVWQLTPCIR